MAEDSASGAPPPAEKPQLSKADFKKELQAAEAACRQLLYVIESWPRFVPACAAPFLREKGADASSAVLVLRGPAKVVSMMSMVCHNAKVDTTADRFRAFIQRLEVVPREILLKDAEGWVASDDVHDQLAKPGAEGSVAVVIAVELSDGTSVHAQAAILGPGLDSDQAERGPWQYVLNDGRAFSLAPPKFNWSGPLRPGRVSQRRPVPESCRANIPDYASNGLPAMEQESPHQNSPPCLNEAQIAKARAVARLGREVLDAAHRAVRPGTTTDELDRVVHDATIDAGSYPAPLNYRNFPKSVCTSVNEVVCHGIPDDRELRDGDIVNVDVSCILDGFYGDLNETFVVGTGASEEVKQLVKCAHDALMLCVEQCKPGARYRDMGDIISDHVRRCGFYVDKTYCGHGVGETFHHAPSIPHYANNKARGTMKPGHVFTIEPMINMGTWRDKLWPDGWTAVTQDGKPSAQFEHMLLITDTGVEVLSARLPTSPPLWWEV